MKRRNVQQAFVGEGSSSQDALAEGDDGDDAVEFDLRGGRIMLTAAATTPDDQALEVRPKRGLRIKMWRVKSHIAPVRLEFRPVRAKIGAKVERQVESYPTTMGCRPGF